MTELESGIQNAVRDYLRRQGWYVVKIHQSLGSFKVIADLYATRDGRSLWLEVKTPRGKQSEHQAAFGCAILAHGGEYAVVRSVEDMERYLREHVVIRISAEKGGTVVQKIYIAGKITGEENYRQKFKAAQSALEMQGHLVMNPAVLPPGFDYEDYMRICFAMIDVCDAVYFLADWRDSPGAMREHEYASRLGKVIEHEEVSR